MTSLFFHGARRRPPSWSNAGRSRGHFLHNGSSQQQTLVDLFGPVEQSVDTNSPSHFLMRPAATKYHNFAPLEFLNSGSERLPHRCIVSHAALLPTRPRCCHDCVSGVSQPKHRRHSDAALHQLQIHPTAARPPAARPSRVASALTVDGSNFLYCLTDRGCMNLKRS